MQVFNDPFSVEWGAEVKQCFSTSIIPQLKENKDPVGSKNIEWGISRLMRSIEREIADFIEPSDPKENIDNTSKEREHLFDLGFYDEVDDEGS
jgi:hypothetical protein